MRKATWLMFLAVLSLAFLAGCSSSSSTPPIGGGKTAPVSLTMTDTPPAGVTPLSFELTVTGAVLQPGNVNLLSPGNQVDVEVTQLQTESAFLSTVGVNPGQYTSLTVTFANPELTIQNNSGAAVAGCANGAICQLKPAISPVSVTFDSSNSSLFPITLTQNMPFGLQIDVNMNLVIQNDLSINLAVPNGVTLSKLPAVQLQDEQKQMEDLTGKVVAVGTNQFDLQPALGPKMTVKVDTNTKFDFPAAVCATNNFPCIQVGQILEVDFSLLGDGTLLAKEVDFEDDQNQEDVEGTITSVVNATQFNLVVHDEVPNVANVAVSDPIVVNIQSGASFRMDSNGLTVPSGLSFASAADLLVGQEVQVRLVGAASPGPPITVTTDRITLHMSQITGTISAINGNNFTLASLPALFTNAGINQIQVQTSAQTNFDGASGMAGLATGNTVSVKGLLFNTAGSPTLLAKKVRKR